MILASSTTSLSPFVMIALPFIGNAVAGVLQHKELPHAKATNAIIAAVFFLATSALCWLIGGSISSDPGTNLLYYSAVLGLIFNATPCKALNEALVEAVPSPLLWLRKAGNDKEIGD